MFKKLFAKFVKPDPRIGKLALCRTSGFIGIITKISKLQDGSEWIEIKSSPSGAAGMSENFEILED
jgi:hypothetical protein